MPDPSVSIYLTTTVSGPDQLDILKHGLTYIRQHYPSEKVIVISDGSDDSIFNDSIKQEIVRTYNIKLIESKNYDGLAKSGELLRLYFYAIDPNPTEYAICIHDSQLINSRLKLPNSPYQFLFTAPHWTDPVLDDINVLSRLNSPELMNLYFQRDKWMMCFGAQCIVKHAFIKELEAKYPSFFKGFLKSINSRVERMCCERMTGLIFCSISPPIRPMFGNIFEYAKSLPSGGWGYTYADFASDITNNPDALNTLPTIKIWVGR